MDVYWKKRILIFTLYVCSLYLAVTGLLAGDQSLPSPGGDRDVGHLTPGCHPWSPGIKQLKLTRWQSGQDYNILLSIKFNNDDLPRDSFLDIENFKYRYTYFFTYYDTNMVIKVVSETWASFYQSRAIIQLR